MLGKYQTRINTMPQIVLQIHEYKAAFALLAAGKSATIQLKNGQIVALQLVDNIMSIIGATSCAKVWPVSVYSKIQMVSNRTQLFESCGRPLIQNNYSYFTHKPTGAVHAVDHVTDKVTTLAAGSSTPPTAAV